ncbi:MAG: hypothetical protein HYY37_02340 [Candidatus Aenigmarchaeota archaeon]|nr:hypothetical protein [Candidatus Aenigmarchaeota archaeon]
MAAKGFGGPSAQLLFYGISIVLIGLIFGIAVFGTNIKTYKINIEEAGLLRAKNTFYLANRSLGMTWYVSTIQTIFKTGYTGVGERYWYLTDPTEQKRIIVPEAGKCNADTANPKICLPQNKHVSDYLLGIMQGYLSIPSDPAVNDVRLGITGIRLDARPNNFWPAYDRVTALVTQRLQASYLGTHVDAETRNDNVIFTPFKKLVAGGWRLVGVATEFSSTAAGRLHDYPASPGDINNAMTHETYRTQKETHLLSKANEIKSWLQTDSITSAFVINALHVKVPTTESGILPPQAGLVLAYDLTGTFRDGSGTSTPPGSGGGSITGIPAPYNTIFVTASNQEGTPAALIAAIFKCGEHAGNACPTSSCKTDNAAEEFSRPWPNPDGPWGTSPKGAKGPFQFMPCTWSGSTNPVLQGYNCVSSNQQTYPVDTNPNRIQQAGGYGRDGNGDGTADIQTLADSVTAAAAYLKACATSVRDPARPVAWNQAWCYNHDSAYADKVYGCYTYLQSIASGMSCPMQSPTISCGSLNSGHATCEHCGKGYGTPLPSWCTQFPRTVTGIDVQGPGGTDNYEVYLPTIKGNAVEWTFVQIEGGASGLGYGKTFRTTAGTDTYEIYLTHLRNEGDFSSGRENARAWSGAVAGRLYPNIDCPSTAPNCGKGHVHIQVQVQKSGQSKQPVANPEITLGLCSSGGMPPPPPPAAASGPGYYYHDEANSRFVKQPFQLDVSVKDYLGVLDCREYTSEQFSWLTEKDTVCVGGKFYACQSPSAERAIPGMEDTYKKQQDTNLGDFQCVTACDTPPCNPIFCKEHDDGINPREALGKQCCEKWNWPDTPAPTWRGGTNTCNSRTYCFGDAYTDKDRNEICDYRKECSGTPTRDDAKNSGCSFYCDAPTKRKWECRQDAPQSCANGIDPTSDAALAQAYHGGACASQCGADALCDGIEPGKCATTSAVCSSVCTVQNCPGLISGCAPWGSEYCNAADGNIWHDRTCYTIGCSDPRGGCYQDSTPQSEKVRDCSNGCSGSTCRSSTPPPPPPPSGGCTGPEGCTYNDWCSQDCTDPGCPAGVHMNCCSNGACDSNTYCGPLQGGGCA